MKKILCIGLLLGISFCAFPLKTGGIYRRIRPAGDLPFQAVITGFSENNPWWDLLTDRTVYFSDLEGNNYQLYFTRFDFLYEEIN